MNDIISELLSDKCFTSAWTKSSKMAKSTVYFNLENSEILEKSENSEILEILEKNLNVKNHKTPRRKQAKHSLT